MRVSQKTDYAVRAMLDLSLHARDEAPARSAQIAQRARVPEKFLEAILVDLRKAGLVRSKRGPEGGHTLARSPGAITLGQIRAAIDGPIALIEATPRRKGTDTVERGLRELWSQVEADVGAVLERVSLEDLQRRVLSNQTPDFSI